MFSSTKYGAWTRFPSSRPCMSVNATTTVSIDPLSTSRFSSVSVSIVGRRREPASPGSLLHESILRGWGGHGLTCPFPVQLFDPRKLLFGSLRDGALEPLVRRQEPPASDEQHRADNRNRCVVEAQPGEVVPERDSGRCDRHDEQHRDEAHPDDGRPSDHLVPAPEVPLARLPGISQTKPE